MGSLLCNMGFLQTLNLPEGAPMPSPVRDRMISGALDLLARRGLQATSFAEVTQATQTPRGSIYHHFPGGKQQLVEIAKALAKEVKLLILDEPTAALNEDDSQHLLDLILSLKAGPGPARRPRRPLGSRRAVEYRAVLGFA